MYGKRTLLIKKEILDWKHHTHACVKAFSSNPLQVQQSVERRFEIYHNLCNMLRKELNLAAKNYGNTDFKGFVNCNLTPEEKENFQAWDVQDDDVWDGLATYGEKGFRFSLSYNKGNANWVATYTGGEGTGKNQGYCVSGFAPFPYEAARVLLFKVAVVLPDVWKERKPSPTDAIG